MDNGKQNSRSPRPKTLGLRELGGTNDCSTPSSSTKSDSSDNSFTSEDFQQLRLKEELDLDMGDGDEAAEMLQQSDVETEASTSLSLDRPLPMTSSFWSCDPSVGVSLRLGTSGPASEQPVTIIEMLQKTVESYGHCLALSVKRRGEWRQWNYEEYYHDCVTAAKAFIKLGLQPHHGVCIIGFNAPEWHIASIAAIMAGGITVGMYITSTPESCCHIATTSMANIIVVESDSQLEKILQVKDKLPHLKAVIHYSQLLAGPSMEEGVLDWNEMMGMMTEECDQELERRRSLLLPNKCCSLIFTSGTTGKPKGVMLSHDNITWMTQRFLEHGNCSIGEERVVSYLPLSHVAPLLLDIYTTIATAGACWFAQPNAMKGSLIETLREVHPTIFLGVPRVWEKIAETMQLISRTTTGFKAWVRDWAQGIGLKGNMHKQSGGSGTPLGWTIANKVVFTKVRKALGLDQCHLPMTGSAPISQDTLSYFMSINIPINELYGMSECTGCCTVTTGDNIRFRATGTALPGVEIQVNNKNWSDSGELVIRGRNLFMGYIGDPQSTVGAFTNEGFLKSGDIGYVNDEGFVYITGRSKDLIILTSGENIAPVPIESALKDELPIISNVVLIGDKREYLICLITLKVEFDEESGLPTNTLNPTAKAVCSSLNSSALTISDVTSTPAGQKVLNTIQKSIDKVNKKADNKLHKIVKWSILDKDFSIPTGELTHTLKLKRKFVAEKYSVTIDSLYSDDD